MITTPLFMELEGLRHRWGWFLVSGILMLYSGNDRAHHRTRRDSRLILRHACLHPQSSGWPKCGLALTGICRVARSEGRR